MSTPFYDLASLVVVPSGYKASKVYAQKPLTTDGQLTFSRASTATRVNSAGLIETVSSNVPRLDYLNSSCPRLLLEPQRTNLALFSEQLNNAAWAATRATITANTTTSPDGYTNADLYTDGTFTGSTSFVEQAVVVGGSGTTYSVFVKKGTADFISFGFYDTSFHGFVVNTTTWASTYTFGSATGFSATNYGNGWYRLTMYKVASSNTIYASIAVQANSTGANYNGTGALNAYFWGAQVEAANSNYATSYIPTLGAAVTRLADACSKSAAFTTSANWTIFAEFDYVNSKKVLDTTFTSSTGRFVGFYNWFGEFRVIYNTGGGAGAGRVVKNTNGKVKVILQNDGTDCFVFLNGVKLGGADTGGPLPITGTLANISFSFYAGTLYDTAKELDKFLIFNQKLTDAQCVELTAL